MKLSAGFTNLKFSVGFITCALLSFVFFNKAITHIPLGTAYAIWAGIGAAGTAIIGMVFFKDPISLARIVLLTLLISAILGLKLIKA